LCNSGQVKLWTSIEVCQENLRSLKNETKLGTLLEYRSKYPIESVWLLPRRGKFLYQIHFVENHEVYEMFSQKCGRAGHRRWSNI